MRNGSCQCLRCMFVILGAARDLLLPTLPQHNVVILSAAKDLRLLTLPPHNVVILSAAKDLLLEARNTARPVGPAVVFRGPNLLALSSQWNTRSNIQTAVEVAGLEDHGTECFGFLCAHPKTIHAKCQARRGSGAAENPVISL